jgi:hypothetical protein
VQGSHRDVSAVYLRVRLPACNAYITTEHIHRIGRWLLAAEARVRGRKSFCDILDGQIGSWPGFHPSLLGFPQ